MRKTIGGLLRMLSVIFIASCGFEMPESLTVTGNPGIHLPLGSPFGASGQSINDYIGQEKIEEMAGAGDSANAVSLYDYQDSSDVQTYLVRYEIAKLNLNLEEHVKDADDITVPPLVIPPSIPESPSSTSPVDLPPLEIELGAIAQWMKNIKLDGAGITILGGAGLKTSLKLKIPQLGIAAYSEGEVENEDLVFTGTTYTLLDSTNPESTKIKVYPQLVGSPASGDYQMELNFKWESATLYPGEGGKFTGTYTIDFGDLTSYLGNAKFRTVPAFVFIKGLPDGANGTMSLTGTGVAVNDAVITPASLDFTESPVTVPIPNPSINVPIDLADLFNTNSSSPLTYTIKVNSVTITPPPPPPPTPNAEDPKIIAEMLIQIPLDFVVDGETLTVEGTGSYKELKLKPLEGVADSNGSDLFGRTGPDDGMLSGIKAVNLKFYNYTNTIIGGLDLFVGKPVPNNTLEGTILDLEIEKLPAPISFDENAVAYPFNPQFKVLVESKDGVSSFTIGRLNGENAKLDFSLALEASADIEQTINF